MDIQVFEQLQKEELIEQGSLDAIKAHERDKPVSVHWDLRTLVYFSILLFTSGLGILLYKNIDTIGHAALVTLAGVLAAACFAYCFKVAPAYTPLQSASPNLWFDYILLLGCLLMLAFVGYLQYQYHVFGMEWGLATFIPMLFLFYCSYFFDHKGVLSLAITNLGAWMGIAVAPLKLARAFDSNDENIIINGVILGVLLHIFSWLSVRFDVKAHFSAVYKNFGMHVLYVALLAAMFRFEDWYFLWFIALGVVVAIHIANAFRRASLYYLVCSVLYGYVGVSYVVVRLLMKMGGGDFPIYTILLYFIGSGIGLVFLLIRFNRQLKNNDSIQ